MWFPGSARASARTNSAVVGAAARLEQPSAEPALRIGIGRDRGKAPTPQ